MATHTKDELRSLLTPQKEDCVSIYLPLIREGANVKQNPIRLKKLLQKVEYLLMKKGWKSYRADDFVRPLKSLLDDEPFWNTSAAGMALFLNNDRFLYYALPIPFREQVMVNQRFLIRPLIPLLDDHMFYVLAISENDLRFLKGSFLTIEQLPAHGVPRTLREALRFNVPERQLQFHTQTPRIPGRREGAMFHGHGTGIDDEKDGLEEYCRQVDRGLHEILKNERAPLIVASVGSLFWTYRKTNTYPYLLEEPVPGNPELLSNSQLRSLAWDLVDSHLSEESHALLHRYVELTGSDLVTNNIEAILSAARQGRVQHLLLNSDEPWWGRYEDATGRVETHDQEQAGDTEIVNLAVLECLRTRSEVHELKPQVQGFPALMAIYRY